MLKSLIYKYYLRFGFYATLVMSIVACEAPLILDGVELSKKTTTYRTDIFIASAVNAENIVIVGSHGLVLVSNDDGESWQRQELPGWPALIDVTTCSNGNIAVLSYEGDIWLSEDKGSSWEARKMGTEEDAQAVTCDHENRLWVVGAFTTIVNSSDMGKTWSVFTTDEDIILNNIQFISDNEAYVSGEFGTLMRTIDGGQTWETLAPIQADFYPQDMYFEDSQHGWVVGLVGVILHTSNGGESWQKQESNTLVSLFRLAKSNQHLFAVGGEGEILHLVDEAWQEVDHGKNIRLYLGGIEALQNNRILVIGPAGTMHILAVDELMRDPAGRKAQTPDSNDTMEG